MNKKKLKQLEKKCIFCKNSNLEQLDVHRIIAGELGGKYTSDNVVVVCCNCHRKLHTTDEIKIDKWFFFQYFFASNEDYNCKKDRLSLIN